MWSKYGLELHLQSARVIATRASLLQGAGPACCGTPLGAMVFAFVGAPPSGRWVVVCKAYRDEGVDPTGDSAPHVVAHPCVRWFLHL
jgi:hypothetical protein